MRAAVRQRRLVATRGWGGETRTLRKHDVFRGFPQILEQDDTRCNSYADVDESWGIRAGLQDFFNLLDLRHNGGSISRE
ncbi:hypothetical protein FA13DRAFT_1743092 [Coprinellus micaceus]|uniref:Uncharacterized protein n=1 Tax=Coprinellus micaceus TaxID=71717 RepID=A0A4Y7SFB1_COPMI|nr:hypothetical protein FA13DRAFT_1743092 [Coprinellus micaceus]